jgi:PAS domain S-box-containing protein
VKDYKEKYHNLFENSVVGIFWASFEEGIMLEENQAMRNLFGLDSFEGAKSTDFYARPEEREDMKEILREQGSVNNLEILFKKKDGTEFWGSHSARLYEEQGVIEGIIIDISSRKWAEEALRKGEAKYRTLFDSANDAIFIWKDGKMIDCNARTLRMFGCAMDDMITDDPALWFSPLLQPDGKNSREGALEKIFAAAAGEPQFFEWKHCRKDETIFDAEVSLNRIELGGEILVQSILRDITERKQAEEKIRKANDDLTHRSFELEAVNKELEAFSYSVSHDLRAPLRAIDGFSQALLEDYHDLLDEQGQDFLTRVRAASQRMAILIDDMLKLSRISRAEMRYATVDLSAIASAIATELQDTGSGCKVGFIIQPGIIVKGDANLLKIAMENLLNNAYKFTGDKSGIIEFGKTTYEGNPVFFVRDNGVGFDMAYANKLFVPFQRLHRDDEFEGIGIGLATVQRIIHRHGGYIRAEGKVDKGAIFYFTI